MNKQRGYIKIVLVVFALLIGIMMFPLKFPAKSGESVNTGETLVSGVCLTGKSPAGDAMVTMPAIKDKRGDGRVDESRTTAYHLIRQEVWTRHTPLFNNTNPNDPEEHTMIYTAADKPGFRVYYPTAWGEITRYGTEKDYIFFRPNGFIFFVHLDEAGEPMEKDGAYLVDFYQDQESFDQFKAGSLGFTYEDIFRCSEDGGLIYPDQDRSEKKDQLQLEWFLFGKSGDRILEAHCKPAVYLYPEKTQLVNVKVFPRGELGYTDPLYPEGRGWTVMAYPSGKLEIEDLRFKIKDKDYDYLYYESRLYDTEIKKPEVGWSVRKTDMEELFNRILPQLGLNQKEQKDFEDYWLSKLPESPYYFVGLVDKGERDRLERLEVTPNPDTSIRFSLFFEPIEEFRVVKEPVIETPKRNGFTLVDWGGMIKLNPGTPFTCSQ